MKQAEYCPSFFDHQRQYIFFLKDLRWFYRVLIANIFFFPQLLLSVKTNTIFKVHGFTKTWCKVS